MFIFYWCEALFSSFWFLLLQRDDKEGREILQCSQCLACWLSLTAYSSFEFNFWWPIFWRRGAPMASMIVLLSRATVKTRSQAVARIAVLPKIVWVTWHRPRPVLGEIFVRLLVILHTKPCTKFEVCSSSNFGDMFDYMPKILGVMWLRPRPLLGEIFVRPLGISNTKLHTKFEVSSSSSFRDIAL